MEIQRENADLAGIKGKLGGLNPETPVNELIDTLGELEFTVTPLDTDIKDTSTQSGDLLKSLADLNAELDDFNKSGRLGVYKEFETS
ncbi:MAG: hypothetical protein IPK55_15230 [Streptococcus sp.]|nr:hypothetical protein [Streptococcus sp.]